MDPETSGLIGPTAVSRAVAVSESERDIVPMTNPGLRAQPICSRDKYVMILNVQVGNRF